MQVQRYTYQTYHHENHVQYAFVSVGQNGHINKMISFSKVKPNVYNLSLEDMDDDTGVFSQYSVTDNGDTIKILLTVAEAIVHFTSDYPYAQVFIQGNNAARNRLYRIYIAKFLENIHQWYEVYALQDDVWEEFRKEGKYRAYLVFRKKSNNLV